VQVNSAFQEPGKTQAGPTLAKSGLPFWLPEWAIATAHLEHLPERNARGTLDGFKPQAEPAGCQP